MHVARSFTLALVAAAIATSSAFAEGEDEDEDEEEEADEDAAEPEHNEPAKPEPFVKQNLSGHDLGTTKKSNLFEKDRFFVDKVDSETTENTTLIQGSLQSSSLFFTEYGDDYVEGSTLGKNSARFNRMFTELRLQTDFRHIRGSRWEARVDARTRVINSPDEEVTGMCETPATPTQAAQPVPCSVDPNRVQGGFNGSNEYDIRELWLFRRGTRSDVFFGRQFVADLGAVKFDGLRIDYASSRTLTLIGFAGLYPLRGSRSITTDYPRLKDNGGGSVGRFVGTGGFGGAYRTTNAYGAIGGVVMHPFSSPATRVFLTSTGYLRSGATLDFYHFALVDLYCSACTGLTNLSIGANYKPNPRLRLTASVNRVDVDTLTVQANAFLAEPENQPTLVQNETYFRRLATNVFRVGLSAGLGRFQRFELSFQAAFRYRPSVAIPQGNGTPAVGPDGTMIPTTIDLQGNKGVDLYAQLVDRHSFKDLRLGLDVTRSFGIGDVAFNRSEILAVRGFASRELANGHGEWEADVSYTTTKDSATPAEPPQNPYYCQTIIYSCYGSSNGAILGASGNLYYRFNREWFVLAHLALSRQTLIYGSGPAPKEDPPVYGVMAFFRAAYRF